MLPDNDNIERFFKRTSRKTDIQFNEADWDSLEKRLDARAASRVTIRSKKIKMAFLAVMGLLSISVLTYVFNSRDQDTNSYNSRDIISPSFDNGKANLTVEAEKKQNMDAMHPALHSKLEADNGSAGVGYNDTISLKVGLAGSDKSEVDVTIKDQRAGFESHSVFSKDRISKVENTSSNMADPLPLIAPASKDQSADLNSLANGKLIVGTKLLKPTDVLVVGYQKDSTYQFSSKSDSLKATNHVENDSLKNKKQITRWSFVLSGAPDFSSLQMSNYTTPGSIFGVVAYYQFFPRWSVGTGLMYGDKNYVGAGSEYRPPSGFWKKATNGIIPQEINGSCKVFEIPILVQFKLIDGQKNQLFAKAGVSSYFLKDEYYDFQFSLPNPGAKEEWISTRASNYWFGITNFSIAYERIINPSFSVGVEPYLKIPVNEIGWSNLYSTGAYINLRYKILKKSKYRSTSNK